jgi:hypothetical protein
VERGKGNARIVGLDAFSEEHANSLLKIGLRFPGGQGKRVKRKLVAVEQEGQFRYFISGNNPFGNSVF